MADFNFYVNRQGVQGVRGAKGEQGFSPVISVKTQTASEYVLQVENEDGTFDTPNLRGNAIENSGGTYIRFNPETEEMYTGEADAATTSSSGVVRLSTLAELEAGDVEDAVPSAMDVHEFVENSLSGSLAGYVTTSDFNDYTTATDTALSNKLEFSDLSSSLVAGDNISLDVDSETKEITINNTASFTQVQADWNENDNTDPSYIKNKPSIPAAQIQSDWNQVNSTAVDFIKNKPTIPTVGNGTVTFTQGGVEKGSITMNQSGNTTIALDAGGGGGSTPTDVQINGVSITSNNTANILTNSAYDEASNKIATMNDLPAAANNATLTITQGGVSKGTFTANASTDVTIALDAGGGSSLTAGNGIDINQDDEIDIVQQPKLVGGVPNYTEVGTVTIDSSTHAASGFSASNYLKSQSFTPDNSVTKAEINVKINTSGYGDICCFYVGTYNDVRAVLHLTSDRRPYLCYGGSSEINGSALPENTDVYLKAVYTITNTAGGGNTSELLYSLDGETFTSMGTFSNTWPPFEIGLANEFKIGVGGYSSPYYFNGTIYLNECNYKINDVLAWEPYTTSLDYSVMAMATNSLYGIVKPDGSTTSTTNGVISTVNMVQSLNVRNIVQCTQAEYDALVSGGTVDANTFYAIVN